MSWDGVDRRINRVLTDADIEAIIQKQREAGISCPLDVEGRKAAMSFYALASDMGDGSPEAGIRTIRKNMDFVGALREKKNVVTGLALAAVSLSLFGWLGKIFWEAVFKR